LWYNREAFDQMLALTLLAAVVDTGSRTTHDPTDIAKEIGNYYAVVRALRQAQAGSDYRVDKLLEAARGETPAPAAP
jgi:hypothetical protein